MQQVVLEFPNKARKNCSVGRTDRWLVKLEEWFRICNSFRGRRDSTETLSHPQSHPATWKSGGRVTYPEKHRTLSGKKHRRMEVFRTDWHPPLMTSTHFPPYAISCCLETCANYSPNQPIIPHPHNHYLIAVTWPPSLYDRHITSATSPRSP